MRENIEKYWNSEEFQDKYQIAGEEISNYIFELSRRYEQEYGMKCLRFTETRIKTIDSICGKLQRKGLELNPKVMEKKINDLAGVRMICFNTNQIYRIAKMISEDDRYQIIKAKDYITSPKHNGYQSYHIVVQVPVTYHSQEAAVRVEIQLRTILMDAWASMDAIVRYKKKKATPKNIEKMIEQFTKSIRENDVIIRKIMEANSDEEEEK